MKDVMLISNAELLPQRGIAAVSKQRYKRHKIADQIATGVMWIAALFLVGVLFVVVATILYQGFPALSWNFLTTSSSLTESGAGIGPQLWDSLYVLLLTMFFTAPLESVTEIGAGGLE